VAVVGWLVERYGRDMFTTVMCAPGYLCRPAISHDFHLFVVELSFLYTVSNLLFDFSLCESVLSLWSI